MKFFKIIIFLLFSLVYSAVCAGDPLSDSENLFEQEKAEKAIKVLKRNIRKSDTELSLQCRIRLAEHYDSMKEFSQALKLLKDYDSFSGLDYTGLSFRLCLEAYGEHAFASGASGDVYSGMKSLDVARDRTKNLENALVSYCYAKLLHYYSKDNEALGHINSAYGRAEEYLSSFSIGDAEKKKIEENYWTYLKRKLDILKEEIEFSLFAAEYGMEYSLYKRARTYHFRGKYRQAAGFYNRLISEFGDTIFAEAGRCYRIDCMLKDSDFTFREIEKEALEFVSEKPYGLYNGETLAILGGHAIEALLDSNHSEKYYAQAYDFCERMRKLKENELFFKIPDKVLAIGVVDSPFETYDSACFTVRREIAPEEIVNPETNKHYLDNLQKECAFMLGFVKFCDGKIREAEKLFMEAGNFDKSLLEIDSKKMPNALARLRGACKQGFLYIHTDELKHFGGEEKLTAQLADFYYALEYFDKARALYSSLTSSDSPVQRTESLIQTGNCLSFKMESKTAEEFFKAALKSSVKLKNPRYHALYAIGCFYSAQGKKADALRYLNSAAKKGKGTYYGRLSHNRLITDLGFSGEIQRSKSEYKKYCEIYSDSPSESMKSFFEYCESNCSPRFAVEAGRKGAK